MKRNTEADSIFLTVQEAANCFKLPIHTLERWIRQGCIPVTKDSRQRPVFKASVLKQWAREHHIVFSPPSEPRSETAADPVLDSLLESMKRGGVYYDIKAGDAAGALRSAIHTLSGLTEKNATVLYENLTERERLSSTGIGNGAAIPHPRSPLPDIITRSRICTCFLDHPVDFNAVDNEPVFVMFVLLCPSTKSHLHLLSRLSYCLRDNSFIGFLKTSPKENLLFSKIEEFENNLDVTNPT